MNSSSTGDASVFSNNENWANTTSKPPASATKRCRKIIPLKPMDLKKIEREMKELEREWFTTPIQKTETDCKIEEETEEDFDDYNREGAKQRPKCSPKESAKITSPVVNHILETGNKINVPSQTKRVLENEFVTPKNKIPSKVQWSLNTKSSMFRKNEGPNAILDNCELFNNTVLEDKFEKIVVNGAEYKILNELGKGGSSRVLQCYHPTLKEIRAIKCVSLENDSSAIGFMQEVSVLKALQGCDRIIKMFDYEIRSSDKMLYVVLEMGGRDLSKIIKERVSNKTKTPLYILWFYWMEMLYAVQQIHQNGIIHLDLKPANFLIKTEGGLKLIDFGISTCVQGDVTSVIKVIPEGSFNYISPEAVRGDVSKNNDSPSFGKNKYKLSYKSDVWSLGCILYQLVYNRTPFQQYTQMIVKLHKITDPNHVIEYPQCEWAPKKIIGTIKKCLQFDMKLRPSIDELIVEYENSLK